VYRQVVGQRRASAEGQHRHEHADEAGRSWEKVHASFGYA
jgi:hypothetical protein